MTLLSPRRSAAFPWPHHQDSSTCVPKDFPEVPVVPSEGSIKGLHYIGATNQKVPNVGQQQFQVVTENGIERRITFQSAAVRKPLLSVSNVCDKGQMVIFDNGRSVITNRNSKAGKQIQSIVAGLQPIDTIDLHRENGVYTMPLWVPPQLQASPFQGPGTTK